MVDRLVALIEGGLKDKARRKPQLRVVDSTAAPAQGMDGITRESHIRMIGHLRRRHGLQMLVDQATFGVAGVEQLSDQELVALHRDLERAQECIADGVSFEEAGLFRSNCS